MDGKQHLVRTLYQVFGNNGYMRQIEELIKKLPTTGSEESALHHLSRAIKNIELERDQAKKKYRRGY